MADSIKINKLEIENVKRIKAVKIEPTKNGLTIVGGNNNQGKTSVLDSIAWALGGDRYKPSNATRDGSTIPPNLHIVMSNGLVVERKGKNSSLKMLQEKMERHEALSEALEAANKTVNELHDESTAELEASIANIEEINRKVRANLDKDKAEEDAKAYQDQYNELTKKIEDVRDQKTELLNAADLPLPELSVKEGELVYKGQQWDNMSGSDRLKVSTAIVRKLNPKCGFVLLDKLEQMDLVTLNEFGSWLEQEGLQAIATRVSTGDECSIIIEDGYVVKDLEAGKAEAPAAPTWKAGVF